jgi:NodT family efflux transporter outer membrane factor (OMF) lipoprotein
MCVIMRRLSLPLSALSATALVGCAPSVQLSIPPGLASEDWSVAIPSARAVDGQPLSVDQALGSEQLEQLLAQARENNREIAMAAARVEQARGLLSSARSTMLPAVNANINLSSSRERQLGNSLAFDGAFAEADVSFSLDIWGRNRARNRAAAARVQSEGFRRAVVLLTIETEVVRSYVRGCTLAERLLILDRNIANAEELSRIIRARFNAGAATRVDVSLQAIQLRQLQTERLRLQEAMGRIRTALAVLVGEEAPEFAVTFDRLDALQIPSLMAIQPSDLLVRRPDIRAAEFDLLAANADVRAARAAFLPQIDLSSRNLVQSSGLGLPLSLGSSLSADILAPIFGRGRLRGDLTTASGSQLELANAYRQAVLVALADVENAIEGNALAEQRAILIEQIVDEAQLAARLSRSQYLNGESDMQELLNAQGTLSEAEDARALAIQEKIEAVINFTYAVGGSADIR